ncbi:hypothetical protein ES703_81896 [subsurface metagenome]
MLPRKGIPISLATLSPPPSLKRAIFSPHLGQISPLIFSTIPSIFKLSFCAKVTDFLTSRIEISWGVVTIIALVAGTNWAIDNGSSPVPGGASTINQSRAPHWISFRNCSITFILSGPLQIIASFLSGRRNPIEASFRLSLIITGSILLSLDTSICSLSTPSIKGRFGPCISISKRPTL